VKAKRIEYHEGAISDVRNAVTWYRKRSLNAASALIEELDRAPATILDVPDRWLVDSRNTRRFLLWRFPFSVIYSEQNSVITVWAVAHGNRRPDYWDRRLE
jgi:plasmid stabilization system protein ParE